MCSHDRQFLLLNPRASVPLGILRALHTYVTIQRLTVELEVIVERSETADTGQEPDETDTDETTEPKCKSRHVKPAWAGPWEILPVSSPGKVRDVLQRPSIA